ncbi:pre-mRNA-splicing factor CWC25 homolog [Gouania willdenowi]|uniref:CBF1-interacting co-repressor CIR N-terminal domain-containing protein n=1 Tax=Gouania willdenowi TaxID=441366 RepID=A0A8C5D5P4_GOUWI|nr:pre-mRNA-splicing factor CWC25 homolog [Gouania willdenowi]
MGGGDLNLKKSWHPQTMKNIERVWKAEQKHEAERKKIDELQKELKEERAREEITRFAENTGAIKKKDDRLDWMYQGPAGSVSRDEYLMGRPIDKQITDQYTEQESGPSAETGLLPGSIFNPDTGASSLDLAAKIREDPLFTIRKREEEKKREVLTNPVKMRKIKEMLRQNLEKKDKKKKKRKKDKKEKKGDKERRKEKKHKRRSSGSSSEEDDEKRHGTRDKYSTDGRSGSHHLRGYGLQVPAGRQHHQPSLRRERSRSRSPHRDHRDARSFSSSQRVQRSAVPRTGSPTKERYIRHTNNVSKKLSADELERKRLEMMDQAKQRDEDRENNVRRYKRQDEQEKLRERQKATKREQHTGFIHDMKLESAASSSLEDRVKRNIHSIQRTPASLDNFMRR